MRWNARQRQLILAANAGAFIVVACTAPGPRVPVPTPDVSASGTNWADPTGTVSLPSDSLRPSNLHGAAPRYPTELRSAGVEGAVVVTFVVDTTVVWMRGRHE